GNGRATDHLCALREWRESATGLHALDILVVLVNQKRGGEESRRFLVTKPRGPGGESFPRSTFIAYTCFDSSDVSSVEFDCLVNRQILVGIVKRDLIPVAGAYVQSRVQFSPQLFVVRPQRERVTILSGGRRVDQIQRTSLGVIIEFL